MEIVIKNNNIRIKSKYNKDLYIRINDETGRISFDICQNGMQCSGELPSVVFYKEHTIIGDKLLK